MVRLVLQRPAGTDVAFIEATNAKAARVIDAFLRWRLSRLLPAEVDEVVRGWLGLPELVVGDPLLDLAAMTDADKATAYLEEIRRYTVSKARQMERETAYASKRAEADAAIDADPVEWA